MTLALAAIAITAAAICLWAWPALEAGETKRLHNRQTMQRRKRLTETDITSETDAQQPPPAGRCPR